MLKYIKFVCKGIFGFMIIIAIDIMLKKVDKSVGDFWLLCSLISYIIYCVIEYTEEN